MYDRYKERYRTMTDRNALFHMVINLCYDYTDDCAGSEIDSLDQLLALTDRSYINKIYNRNMYKLVGNNTDLVERLIDWVANQLMDEYNRITFNL